MIARPAFAPHLRVDLIPGPGGAPILIELELTEKEVHFPTVAPCTHNGSEGSGRIRHQRRGKSPFPAFSTTRSKDRVISNMRSTPSSPPTPTPATPLR